MAVISLKRKKDITLESEVPFRNGQTMLRLEISVSQQLRTILTSIRDLASGILVQ